MALRLCLLTLTQLIEELHQFGFIISVDIAFNEHLDYCGLHDLYDFLQFWFFVSLDDFIHRRILTNHEVCFLKRVHFEFRYVL